MRILHVNRAISGGGVEQYLAQIFPELEAKGHRNFLLYGEPCAGNAPLSGTDNLLVEGVTGLICSDPDSKIGRAAELLFSYDPHLVYIHQVFNPSLIDLLTERRPSVRFVHDHKMICPDGRKTLKTRGKACGYPLGYACQIHAYRYRCMPRNIIRGIPLIRNARRIVKTHRRRSRMVVASRFMKSVLMANGFEETGIHVIPYFTNIPDSADPPPSGNEPVLLCVGRVVADKGMHHLIKALPLVHEGARLIIAGDGPGLKGLESLANALGLSDRIHFKGWVSHDGLARLYRECTMAVVPSVWPEPFGIVGIEAMAYRRPVIACDVGGIPDWLQDGKTGLLVKAGDGDGLAEKINYLLDHPDAAALMGERGRDMVKDRFAPEAHVNRLLQVFSRVV